MKTFNEFAYTFTRANGIDENTRSMAFEALANGIADTLECAPMDAASIVLRLFERAMQTAAKHGVEPGDAITASLYAEGLSYAPGETAPCPRQGYGVTCERTETGFSYTTRGFVYHRRGAPVDATGNVRTRLIRKGQNMGVTV